MSRDGTGRRTRARTRGGPRRAGLARFASVAITALLCAAPVPGDIGACGQPVQRLDPGQFFAFRKNVDCRRCKECGIATRTCSTDCDRKPPVDPAFPVDCEPLVHDGEVCLRALLAASCDDYASYVQDEGATVPTECNFCPVGAGP